MNFKLIFQLFQINKDIYIISQTKQKIV